MSYSEEQCGKQKAVAHMNHTGFEKWLGDVNTIMNSNSFWNFVNRIANTAIVFVNFCEQDTGTALFIFLNRLNRLLRHVSIYLV